MDEFNDLDHEIAKLKQELASGMTPGSELPLPGPAATEFWKHRIDEEKHLADRRVQIRDEEKRMLETKLTQQQEQIEKYHQALQDLNQRLDRETDEMEGRLKAKEADLLIEKNRLEAEEKVKDTDARNRRLTEECAELSTRIAALKEERAAAEQELRAECEREHAAFEEVKQELLSGAEQLRAELARREQALAAETAVAQQTAQERDAAQKALVETRETAARQQADAAQAASAFAAEKQRLAAAMDEQAKKAGSEITSLENGFTATITGYVQQFIRYYGPAAGLTAAMTEKMPSAAAIEMLNDVLGKLEEQTRVLAARTKTGFTETEPYSSAAVLTEEDAAVWQKSLAAAVPGLAVVPVKRAVKKIRALQPRLAVISGAYVRLVRAVHRALPLLPLVVVGGHERDIKRLQRLRAQNLYLVAYASDPAAVIETVSCAAVRSAMRPEYQDRCMPRRSFLLPVLLGLGLALAATAAGTLTPTGKNVVAAAISRYGAVHRAYAMPYARPTNIACDGANLWACDWFGQSIYQHDKNLLPGIKKIFYFPGRHFAALAWGGGALWSADPWQKKINQHNTDENMTIVASYPSPGSAPSGLAAQNGTLWSCDAARREIYRHSSDAKLSVAAVYPSPGPSPSGLYFDGEYLWSADSKTNRLYQHRLDSKLTVLASYLPPDYAQKGRGLSGIAGEGKTIWLCCEKAGMIVRYPKKALQLVRELPGSASDKAAVAEQGVNVSSNSAAGREAR